MAASTRGFGRRCDLFRINWFCHSLRFVFPTFGCPYYGPLVSVAHDPCLALQKRLQGLEKSLVTSIMGK